MKFIQCKNCNEIINVQDFKMPVFTEDIKALANAENTIKGDTLCSSCQVFEDEKNKPVEPEPIVLTPEEEKQQAILQKQTELEGLEDKYNLPRHIRDLMTACESLNVYTVPQRVLDQINEIEAVRKELLELQEGSL